MTQQAKTMQVPNTASLARPSCQPMGSQIKRIIKYGPMRYMRDHKTMTKKMPMAPSYQFAEMRRNAGA